MREEKENHGIFKQTENSVILIQRWLISDNNNECKRPSIHFTYDQCIYR